MKTTYILAAVFALLYWRHRKDESSGGISRVHESLNTDGTNFQSDLWGTLSGANLASPNFPNLIPGSPNADPGGNAAARLQLMPAWDGSLQ